jgi:hypothetical protein
MSRLGVEQLSVLGLGPLEFVNLVADLGCNCILDGIVRNARIRVLLVA